MMIGRHRRSIFSALRLRRLAAMFAASTVTLMTTASAPMPGTPGSPAVSIKAPVILLPLNGPIGVEVEKLDQTPVTQNYLDDFILSQALSKALEGQPTPAAIILEISGAGGTMNEALSMIRRLGRFQSDHPAVTLVAWIGPEAFSATAEIALACPILICKAECSLGAAVIYGLDAEGRPFDIRGGADDAVRRKFYSAYTAPLEEAQDRAGRPRCIERSMRILEAQLWWSPTLGFRDSPDERADWQRVDPPDEILTLTRTQLLKFGICRGSATTMSEVLQLLGLPPDTPVKRLDKTLTDARIISVKKCRRMLEELQVVFRAMRLADGALLKSDDLLLNSVNSQTVPDWGPVRGHLENARTQLTSAITMIEKAAKPPAGWEDSSIAQWRAFALNDLSTRLRTCEATVKRADGLAARGEAGIRQMIQYALQILRTGNTNIESEKK